MIDVMLDSGLSGYFLSPCINSTDLVHICPWWACFHLCCPMPSHFSAFLVFIGNSIFSICYFDQFSIGNFPLLIGCVLTIKVFLQPCNYSSIACCLIVFPVFQIIGLFPWATIGSFLVCLMSFWILFSPRVSRRANLLPIIFLVFPATFYAFVHQTIWRLRPPMKCVEWLHL